MLKNVHIEVIPSKPEQDCTKLLFLAERSGRSTENWRKGLNKPVR